jgi:hypothetical protein
LIILIMFGWHGVEVMKLLIMQFRPISRNFISLRSKYFPQHPVLRHPQITQYFVLDNNARIASIYKSELLVHIIYAPERVKLTEL